MMLPFDTLNKHEESRRRQQCVSKLNYISWNNQPDNPPNPQAQCPEENDGHPYSTRKGSRQRITVFLTDSTRTRDNNNRAENPMATHTQPVKAVGEVSEMNNNNNNNNNNNRPRQELTLK